MGLFDSTVYCFSLSPVGDIGGCEISEALTIKELGYGQVLNKYHFIKCLFLVYFVRRSFTLDEFSTSEGVDQKP